MSNYTIHDFWQKRLTLSPVPTATPIPGWSFVETAYEAFKEAPLALSMELSLDENPLNSPLLLVSAPGAVGKSTLARHIAFATGAVYLDLAKAEPVGGNTISGGLLKSGLYTAWQSEHTTLLIDGLDEARLRVTQEAFEAFLADVAQLSKNRTVPVVLFGRTGAIQDAWLLLVDGGATTSVLEIGYYDPAASVDFAEARVQAMRPNSPHGVAQRHALELLLERLRVQTQVDGDRFAGYAPVLQAVADHVAEENPASLLSQIEKGEQPVTLQTVVTSILNRERGKLDQLRFEDPELGDKLYLPDEQLDRLVARVYGLPAPRLPVMRPADAHTYSTALDTWVAEHPFLTGRNTASSAVFEAVISVRAMKNPASAEVSTRRELGRGSAANPFLSEFYLPDAQQPGRPLLPPEHVGAVYASLRARLSLGDSANLSIEGPEDADDEEALRAEVEITLARKDTERPRVLQFETEQTGVLQLGGYIEDVDLSIPYTHVEMGPGAETVLVAPVNIQCDRLRITTEKVIVESARGSRDNAVFLEAEHFDGEQVAAVPILRGQASLAVAWPNARRHPWTSFATDPTPIADPRIDEALRRFRRFVVAFRSHSKGRLARYRDKIEHARMTKGTGQAVLDLMVEEGIVSLEGPMYFLDPARLAQLAGTTYADCVSRQFGKQAFDFVERAL